MWRWPRTAVGGGPGLRTGGSTQVHRLRTVRLAALLVGLAMVAAACGGGGNEGGGTSGGGNPPNIVVGMFPFTFHAQPDFTVKMDDAFLDSAEQTSEDPQTIVYKIKQEAIWS